MQSHNQHEPAEEKVEKDDGVQRQLSLPRGNHFSHEGNRSYIRHCVHKVDQRKLAKTAASLKMGGIHDSTNSMVKEATLMGNMQYPSRLALWNSPLRYGTGTSQNPGNWR